MSPKTAKFLLSGVEAFQKEPNLAGWNGMSRAKFFWLVTQLTLREVIEEAVAVLRQIAEEELAPTIPPNLKELVASLEAWEEEAAKPTYPDKQAFLQVRAAKIVAIGENLEKQGLLPKKEVPPAKVVEEEAVAEPVPAPPEPEATRVFLVKRKVPQPVFSRVVSQVSSLPARPFKTLHTLALEQLNQNRPEEAQNLFLLWQEGVEAKKLLEAAKSLPEDSPQRQAIAARAASLERYQRSHPFLTSFFQTLHSSQALNLEFFLGRPTFEQVRGGRAVEFLIDRGARRVTSIAHLPLQVGKPGLFSRAFSFLGKTRIAKAATAPLKKAAAGFLVRLGLTSVVGAATGGAAFLPALLLTGAKRLLGQAFWWVRGRFQQVFTKREWGFWGLATAGGLVALGVVFPPLAPLFFGAGALVGSATILARFASSAGAALARTAVSFSGLLSGVTGALGIGAAVMVGVIAGAVGIPAVLTAYTNLTYQSSFLEEAAAEVPAVCISPEEGVFPPGAFPAPSGVVFSWPVDGQPVCTSPFGYRVLDGSCNQHEGLDIRAPQGTEITPIAEGIVYAFSLSVGAYGNYVIVDHGGMYSLYAHLSEIYAARVGGPVDTQTVLGLSGSTGRSRGAHLHLSVSSCGSVVGGCFITQSPDPCNYLSCPAGCSFQDSSVCADAPICQ